jgi:dTDP-4-dehydrorhamnose 3,5-epimerase-like enzyme
MIPTKDIHGNSNGWLLPLWHVDSGEKIDQVYLTVVNSGAVKGPHLHTVRCGRFICIKGNVLIVMREGDGYREQATGDRCGFATVRVPPGIPAAIYNLGTDEAYVINMPTPPWRDEDRDEYPVPDWNYKP